MTDPVLALVLVAIFFATSALASFFKTLDSSFLRDAAIPLFAGLIVGVAVGLLDFEPEFVLIGIAMTAAALYVRLTGRESEPSAGMLLGAWTGAAAAIPLVFLDRDPLLPFAESVLAGAVAGFGITFGLTHVRARLRQAGVDILTAAAAVGAAWLPEFVSRFPRVDERQLAISTTALIPLLLIALTFTQWPSVLAELRHEAALGVIDEEDIRPTAHPFRRLGRGGWHDGGAHREFVRIANRIALRKRQQRQRPDDVARIYQLEVIKLRMQLQEMARIDRMLRAEALDRQQVAG